MPPNTPRVTYRNGLLTIDAQNSTLSQVLRTVQAQMGASVEMPSGAAGSRVMMQIGPGRPRDVLNTLLNGSKFNYILLGVLGDAGAVQKIILTNRQGPATVSTAQNNPASQYQPPTDEGQDEEMIGPGAEAENPPPETRPMAPGRFRPGQIPMPPPETNPAPVDNANQFNNGGKTPEELLQELQNMQQQQQMYQQQLNPANQEPQPQPPPQ